MFRTERAQAWAAALFFAVAAVAATWPLAARPHELVSLRPDAFMFAWNSWWFRTAVFEQGSSPLWTNELHYPLGISLAAHTFSWVNASLGGVLNLFLDAADATRVLLLLHFWWSGWAAWALAREVTGSARAALAAGIVWSFSPLHFHYLAQLNHATLEFLPLVCLCLLRVQRRGGAGPLAGLLVSVALLTGSCYYYTAYAVIFGVLVLLCGRITASRVPFAQGARRLLVGAGLSAFVVALAGWPLLSALIAGHDGAGGTLDIKGQGALTSVLAASNDLLGFNWRVGGEESVTASWPTMLGYSTMVLLLAGFRGVLRQRFWLLVVAVFFVLGLGPVLRVGGQDTGLPLPYAALMELPFVTSLVRKPDRFFTVVQLGVAVLAAVAWKDLIPRLQAPLARRLVGAAAVLVVALETTVVPLQTFPVEFPAHVQVLAEHDELGAVVNLPHLGSSALSAFHGYGQTVHGKPMPGGYITDQAVTAAHRKQSLRWRKASVALARGQADPLLGLLEQDGVDVVILHRRSLRPREGQPMEGHTTWAPFCFQHDTLMAPRQREVFEPVSVRPDAWATQRQTLAAALGEPLYEDGDVALFSR